MNRFNMLGAALLLFTSAVVAGNGLLTQSPLLKGGNASHRMTADIRGQSTLYLFVEDGGDGNGDDQAIWAEPAVIRADGTRVLLETQNFRPIRVGWATLCEDENDAGQALRIGGKKFNKGWWAHSVSLIEVKLDGPYEQFESFVGIDDKAGQEGSVIFKVYGAGASFNNLEKQALPRTRVKVPFEEQIFSQTFDESVVSLRLAIADIENTFDSAYDGERFLTQLDKIEAQKDSEGLHQLKREALLANPALDFDSFLMVRRYLGHNRDRSAVGRAVGFVANNAFSMQNAERELKGNEIIRIESFRDKPQLKTVYRPDGKKIISDMDLHFDGERILFSSINAEKAFRLYEVKADGSDFRQVTPDEGHDIDHFDACYLPDGDIIFTSTASFNGMPCIDGKPRMACLYRFSPSTGRIRQLSFDQDTSWCPTMLNNGRVAYLRWDYTDMVHSNNRVLMSMNPDGTSQKSILFSNSYFPAAFFYARPIPGDPSKVVGIAGGHHGIPRSGRMLLVDPRLGEHEADGVVQEIPGHGIKVEPVIRDRQVDGIWPHTVHPFPVAEDGTHKGAGKYFLVSMKPTPSSLWGIYLVDIYDNRVLLYEEDRYGCFEPIPLKATPTPPLIPSLIDDNKDTATVYIQDIYAGPGLAGVPRDEVKALRIGSYEFSPSHSTPGGQNGGSGGIHGTLGTDGPWDIKRVLGTVPVFEDGSAHFEIPACTPIFIQPLDANGQALQLMRSWMVGQPGERVSCIGCHENAKTAPLQGRRLASAVAPSKIQPWEGASINFGYGTEIQPIIDRNCMGCHDGKPAKGRYASVRAEYKDKPIPYLGPELLDDWSMRYGGSMNAGRGGGRFSKGYMELFELARGPGIESDMHILTPKEFSADSTELIQMLRKGHHGVRLEDHEWQKLIEWIDLNTPYHGNRLEIVRDYANEAAVKTAFNRAKETSERYSTVSDVFDDSDVPVQRAAPERIKGQADSIARKKGSRPFTAEINADRGDPIQLDLGNGLHIRLVHIPAGCFIMGSETGALDELPMHLQTVEKGFWMAEMEVSNAQFRQFDSLFTSRHEDRIGYQFGQPCYDVNGDELPAVRISFDQAMAFCDWLSERTGKKVTLPTEIQWEWACRAEAGSAFWFGDEGSDFSKQANLADKRVEDFAEDTSTKGEFKYFEIVRLKNPSRYEAYIPGIKSVNDGQMLQCTPGSYAPNPWGLYDMHGNVAEWTRSVYSPYPLKDQVPTESGRRVVRGGSWRDRPYRATSSYRLAYPPYQKVYNVGFRVIIEE